MKTQAQYSIWSILFAGIIIIASASFAIAQQPSPGSSISPILHTGGKVQSLSGLNLCPSANGCSKIGTLDARGSNSKAVFSRSKLLLFSELTHFFVLNTFHSNKLNINGSGSETVNVNGQVFLKSFDKKAGNLCVDSEGVIIICGAPAPTASPAPTPEPTATYSWSTGNWRSCSSSSAGSCSGSWIKNNGITTTTDTGIHCDDEDGGRGDICNYEEGASFCHLNTLYECDNEKVYCNKNSASACTTQNSACSWTNAASSSQSRTVTCVSSTNATVSDSNCPGSKPSVSQSCTPVGTWQTTPAASCSTACGQSATTKYGTVTCSGGNCNQNIKPSRPSRWCNRTTGGSRYVGYNSPYCHGGCGRCLNGGEICRNGVWISNPIPFLCVSFLAGTKITMADGTLKNIELLKKGDKVISSSGETVVEKIHKYTTEEAVYSLNGSRYFVTGSHPFMTLGGWKSFHPENTRRKVPEIKVSQLKIGDTLLRENGESELLEKFDSINGTHEVYNLRVKGSHDFYADGYWVHNK